MDLNHGLDYQRDGQDDQRTPMGDAPITRLDQIDQDLHAQHWDTPQSASLAHYALQKIREGLQDLAKLGHDYHLVHGAELVVSTQEYPKMLTRKDPYPFELVVNDELEEEKARESGYGFHSDGVPQPKAPETALEQLAQQPVGGNAPDEGAKTAVVGEIVSKPPVDAPSSTNLDKTIDGALGAPNNVNYQAPKPGVTDKQALERNKDAGVGASTPTAPTPDNNAKK